VILTASTQHQVCELIPISYAIAAEPPPVWASDSAVFPSDAVAVTTPLPFNNYSKFISTELGSTSIPLIGMRFFGVWTCRPCLLRQSLSGVFVFYVLLKSSLATLAAMC